MSTLDANLFSAEASYTRQTPVNRLGLTILGWFMWTIIVVTIITASAGAIGWLWGINHVSSVSNTELQIVKCIGTIVSVGNIGFWIKHLANFWDSEPR